MICISLKGIMQLFDTSSIVYAWDNYPVEQFPPLWKWIAGEIENGRISFAEVAVGEIAKVSPDCKAWLSNNGLTMVPTSEAILLEALRLKGLLKIEEQYGGGVRENDLLIIATAKVSGVDLVTNERVQLDLNKTKLENYKIPAVCQMQTVKVPCCDFLEFLRRSKAVFG
jgi:predicted nucleic acid-binding protein